jgi:hypothetical protein
MSTTCQLQISWLSKIQSDPKRSNPVCEQVPECVCAATFPRIELGQGPDLDKIANEFPQVFDNTKIPTMAGGYYVIELEDGAVPFNKGSSRTVPEPCI